MQINVEELYRKYGPMVYRRCYFILKNKEKAADAMQDVFVKLLENQNRLKGDYPSSLLYTMATNICLNLIRSAKSRPETADEELLQAIAGKDDVEKTTITAVLLERIFRDEQESTRAIAVMHFIDRMTYEEIAGEVGLSVSGIRKRLRTLSERIELDTE